MSIALIAALVASPMLIETVRAARNERAQRNRGGIEPPGDVYRLMQVAYPGAFLAMLVEGAARTGPPASAVVVGAAVFALAKGLKWWAILTLGQAWTFRVIVVPGVPLVSSGPYRHVRHPNYVGVIGELVGVALMAGAWIAGSVMTTVFLSLIVKRIRIETRALDRLCRSAAPQGAAASESGRSPARWAGGKP